MLVLAVSTATVLGFPTGAPVDACNGLMPNHPSPPNMAVGDSPFYVNTSDIIGGYYMPGELYRSELSVRYWILITFMTAKSYSLCVGIIL